MKIPRKLYIGGWVVPVKYKKGLFVNRIECNGVYEPSEKAIYLKKGMTPARKREIFFHEFVHLIADIYGMRICEINVKHVGHAFSQLFANHNVDFHNKEESIK